MLNVKTGDTVIRLLAGVVEQRLKVTDVQGDLVFCGPWTFDRITGVEIDADLGWGPTTGVTGSYIKEA